MRPIFGLGLAVCAAGWIAPVHPAQAQPAQLRTMVTLDAAVVRLSDLFENAGSEAHVVLGPGPAPGARIVVEARQLNAIARQFGVDWHAASPDDRAVLERPGRPLPAEEVVEALRAALARSGVGPGSDIDLAGYVPPMVPIDATALPVVEQLDYDAASGRFSAALVLSGADHMPVRVNVAGRVQAMAEAPVPVRRLPAGTVLRAEDLRIGRVPAALLTDAMAQALPQAIGMEIQHQAPAGQPLPLSDLTHPPLVLKGATIIMRLDTGPISLSARGQALEAGAPGERIRVLNPISRAVMEAEVTGPDEVRILPDSSPVVPASRSVRAELQ